MKPTELFASLPHLGVGLLVAITAPAFSAAVPTVFEVDKVTAEDTVAFDSFGASIGLDSDAMIVGAAGHSHGLSEQGGAYIFEFDRETGWSQVADLVAADADIAASFGASVAIDGETAAVAAVDDDGAAIDAGAVYIFERDGSGAWIETAKLTASDGDVEDRLGNSLDLDGDLLVVGAKWNDDACPQFNGCQSGSAYIFERDAGDPGSWREVAKLTASDAKRNDWFGEVVAIDDHTVVVGAQLTDEACPGDENCDSGSAYVFERSGDSWVEVSKLTASDRAFRAHFGIGVAISGGTLVVGASGADQTDLDAGAVYAFVRRPKGQGPWVEIQRILASDGGFREFFGSNVDLEGDRLVVGASAANGGTGAAYLFLREDRSWLETAKLLASDGDQGRTLGEAVAISGETIVLGDSDDDHQGSRSGSAYVFETGRCRFQVELEQERLPPGAPLALTLSLEHMRVASVTLPFVVWIERAGGQPVAGWTTAPRTIDFGERFRERFEFVLPEDLEPGSYRLFAGVRGMRQGISWASESLVIVPALP